MEACSLRNECGAKSDAFLWCKGMGTEFGNDETASRATGCTHRDLTDLAGTCADVGELKRHCFLLANLNLAEVEAQVRGAELTGPRCFGDTLVVFALLTSGTVGVGTTWRLTRLTHAIVADLPLSTVRVVVAFGRLCHTLVVLAGLASRTIGVRATLRR